MNRRDMMKTLVAGVGALGAASLNTGEAVAETKSAKKTPNPIELNETKFWLETSLKRVFPNSAPGSAAPLKLLAARKKMLGNG